MRNKNPLKEKFIKAKKDFGGNRKNYRPSISLNALDKLDKRSNRKHYDQQEIDDYFGDPYEEY